MKRAIALLACVMLNGCACGDAFGQPMSVCMESELSDIFQLGLPMIFPGSVVDRDFEVGQSTCSSDPDQTLTMDAGEVGLVRFGWSHQERELPVQIVGGDITARFDFESWGGHGSLLLQDSLGVAAAFNGASPFLAPAVPGVDVTHGDWMGSGVIACGTYSAHTVAVNVDDKTTQVPNGGVTDVAVDGRDFTFFAFASVTLDEWHCTDSSDTLSWALIRD